MPISKEQAKSLYGTDSVPPAQTLRKFSNLDLLKECGSRGPLSMIAETFLRPRMAMKYHLLPALAHELAYARPSRVEPHGLSKEIRLARSVALLLETADRAWRELPKSWIYLGVYFDGKLRSTVEYDEVQAELVNVFAGIHVERPMRFLEKFCMPFPEMAVWRRFFRLSNEEYQDFKNEKERTLEMINADDEDGIARDQETPVV